MKLSDYEMLPGSVIDADDPYSLGRVKANVPMLFYACDETPKAILPWIYPLMTFGYQKFSRMEKGCRILVYFNRDNPEEYWYTPMMDMNDRTREAAFTDHNKRGNEVLLCRASGVNAMITYNDEDGINIKCGEHMMNIHPINGIEICNNTCGVFVAGNNVALSKKIYDLENDTENVQYALLGENVQKAINEFANALKSFATIDFASETYIKPTTPQKLAELAEKLIKASDKPNFISDTIKISR